jgi:hypothetical protein
MEWQVLALAQLANKASCCSFSLSLSLSGIYTLPFPSFLSPLFPFFYSELASSCLRLEGMRMLPLPPNELFFFSIKNHYYYHPSERVVFV